MVGFSIGATAAGSSFESSLSAWGPDEVGLPVLEILGTRIPSNFLEPSTLSGVSVFFLLDLVWAAFLALAFAALIWLALAAAAVASDARAEGTLLRFSLGKPAVGS